MKRAHRASYSVEGRADDLRPFLFFISITITSAMTRKISNQIRLIHGDCMDYLRSLPDNAFDLAIVDPPYGINVTAHVKKDAGTQRGKSKAPRGTYQDINWDNNAPPEDYFAELRRVSRNQIVWGANHFISRLPYDSSCWIVWDKDNGSNDYADCELAWTSFQKAVRKFKWRWNGLFQEDMKHKEVRIHPTQKPVALYKWLLERYAKEGDKILDTHLGSGSSAIAAYDLGFEFTGIEIDDKYFVDALRRFETHTMQPRLDLIQ